MNAILKYPGSKWRIASWVISHMPKHACYVEPFFGSGAVFFNKPPSSHEVINDVDHNVVNLMQVIRDHNDQLCEMISLTPWAREEFGRSYDSATTDPIEKARRFLVRCWQAHGRKPGVRTGWRRKSVVNSSTTVGLWRKLPDRLQAAVERLMCSEIESTDALKLIPDYNHPDVLIYADPPYLAETRSGRQYACELQSKKEHLELLSVLLEHRGPVLLSAYPSPVYDEALQGWESVTCENLAEKGKTSTEVLWMNEKVGRNQLRLFI